MHPSCGHPARVQAPASHGGRFAAGLAGPFEHGTYAGAGMPNPNRTPFAPSPIQACLEQLHARFAELTAGQMASDIPELAKADPALFGIVIATVDG